MSTYRASPLRYPGGKSALLPLIKNVISSNDLRDCAYAEPYAGGAGLALGLLFSGYVSDLYLNDIDAGIFAFWDTVLKRPDDILRRISDADISVAEWQRQKVVLDACDPDPSDLGFATFYVNRTSRSGIIAGSGPIGGFQQAGNYKIDCRFNGPQLMERIVRIAELSDCISFTNLDAEQFMQAHERSAEETVLFGVDPPYYNKGASLYTSFYRPDDHASVASTVRSLQNPWFVTYDNHEAIRQLYKGEQQFTFNIKYSVQTKRLGSEILVGSKDLTIPQADKFSLIAA